MAWKRKTSLFLGAVMLVMAGGMGGGLLVLGLVADAPVASAYYAVDTAASAEPPPTRQVNNPFGAQPFTYQGRLLERGEPVNGACDFRFWLYDAQVDGKQVQTFPTDVNRVKVVNGLFSISVTPLQSPFNGEPRWLETGVRCPSNPSFGPAHTSLRPRQVIEAAPYATYAHSAGSSDTAASATSATDADNLGGRPAVDYALKTDIPTASEGGDASNADTLDGFDSTSLILS